MSNSAQQACSRPAAATMFSHKFLDRCKALPAIKVSVCWPLSRCGAKWRVEGAAAGIIKPRVVGDPDQKIKALAAKIGVDISGLPIFRPIPRARQPS